MQTFLERTAKTYKRSVKEGAHKLHEGKPEVDIFENYKISKMKKKPLTVMFEYADSEGNLSLIDENGIRVSLSAKDFEKENTYYSKDIKERFLSLDVSVSVVEIDEVNKTVRVVPSVTRDQQKASLMRDIFDALKKGEHPRLYGDVMSVSDSRITVNILHKNILGIMSIKDWSPTYTSHFGAVVRPGEIIEFEIVGQAPKKPGADIAFTLSRKEIVVDPWTLLPDFKEGDVLVVKCIDRPSGKNIDRTYWWGTSKMAPGVEIMCDVNQRLRLMNGASYKCRVRKFDKEKHVFQCNTFEVAHSGDANGSNVKFLNGKAKNSPKKID